MQRRRPETVGEGPAQRIARNRLITQGKLAVHRVAEVGEMFVATGDGHREILEQVRVELQIPGIAAAVNVGGAGGRNAGEALGTCCGGPAREAADTGRRIEHADLGGAVGERRCRDGGAEQRAGRKALSVTGDDLEILDPQFGTEGDGQRLGKADIKFATNVEIFDNLPKAQATGIERPLAGCPERGVEAVADGIVKAVVAIADRDIDIPGSERSFHANGRGIILEVGVDERQEAVRRQSNEIGCARCGCRGQGPEVPVRRRILLTIVGGAQAVALAVGCEAVEIDGIGDRCPGVDEEIIILGLGIAEAELQPVKGQFARVKGRGDPVVVRSDVEPGAVGCIAVPIFGSRVEIAILAERQPEIGADGVDVAVAGLAFPAVGCRQNPGIGRVEHRGTGGGLQAGQLGGAVECGDIFAKACGGPTAVALFLQLDVDDPGNGIRTILRRRAVAQHFDPLDGEAGDEVEVNRRRSATNGAVDVEQGRDMAPLAIDQHQRLVRAETAQRGRAQHVGAIGDRGLREVEAGNQRVQNLVGFSEAGVGQRF